METRHRVRLFLILGSLILTLALFNLGCTCSGLGRRKPTPTPEATAEVLVATDSPTSTAEEQSRATGVVATPTSETPTTTREQPAQRTTPEQPVQETTPEPTTTPQKTPESSHIVRWENPQPEELGQESADLAPGTRFELVLTEDYVTDMTQEYLSQVDSLPVDISNITVDFTADQIKANGQVPAGFLKLAVTATGHWKAVDCEFQAEIVDLRIGGQKAPASLREQADRAVQSALEASTNLAACFTAIEIDDTTLTVKGYRE